MENPKYTAAIEALSRLHADTPVSQRETLADLRAIQEEVDAMIDAVEGDLDDCDD